MSDKIGVIIVSYNQRKYFKRLFESLSKQTYVNFCIYFVDNCSTDGSVPYAKDLCKEINLEARFFELDQNTGYSGGNNFGVRKAVSDGCGYCLILNTDTELDNNCILSLKECLERIPGTGASGPILFLGERRSSRTIIQEFGATADFTKYRIKKNYPSGIFENIENEIPVYLPVNFITGACIMIKSSLYKAVGLFDERYFAYGEEIDLFKKIDDAGLKVIVTKKAKVWHHHDWSVKNKKGYYIEYYLMQRNKYLYFKKYHLKLRAVQNIFKDMVMYAVYLPWFIRICDFRLSLYYLKGTLDGIFNRKGKPSIPLFKIS